MTSVTSGIRQGLAPNGTLRAAINLGNSVLAQGTPEVPKGITVDLAGQLAARLGLPVELVCFDAARKSFDALTAGRADVAFLAIEPARAAEVAFTSPYVMGAGIRQPVTAYVVNRPEVRLIEDPFMQIRQAVGTTVSRAAETIAFLRDLVEELIASGFVADSLRRSGQSEKLAAPTSH